MPDNRLIALSSSMLRALRRGIEKESLRVAGNGALSETPHPAGLGSPLTHPHITTDFCEAQVELITDTKDSIGECLAGMAADIAGSSGYQDIGFHMNRYSPVMQGGTVSSGASEA